MPSLLDGSGGTSPGFKLILTLPVYFLVAKYAQYIYFYISHDVSSQYVEAVGIIQGTPVEIIFIESVKA
jgi:hypothetical protein